MITQISLIWSLEQLVAENGILQNLASIFIASNLNEEYKIMTTYESRWINEGRVTKLVRANRAFKCHNSLANLHFKQFAKQLMSYVDFGEFALKHASKSSM